MDFASSVVADFAIIMVIAAVVTFLFHKLKQPLILGYLIAGIIIGPYTPPFSLIKELDVLNAVADLGVILILFGIGLEFPLHRLKRIGLKVYIGISVIEIALMFLISYGIGTILGWPLMDTIFLGTALASSSTVLIAKALKDLKKLNDTSALVMMGVLIAEDLIVVFILTIITSVVNASNGSFIFSDLAWTIGKKIIFVIGILIFGIWFIPRIIDFIAREEPDRDDKAEHDEVLILVALGLCFGLAILSDMVGLSLAVGAFLVGVFVANSKSAGRVSTLTSSVKDMFAAIFFVAMGAFIDISQFRIFLIPSLIVTVVMMVGKISGCGLGTLIFGYNRDTALKVGLGMGQIGEFAFIVMKVGQDLNVISSFLFPTIGIAVAITAFLTPYMIRLSYRLTSKRT